MGPDEAACGAESRLCVAARDPCGQNSAEQTVRRSGALGPRGRRWILFPGSKETTEGLILGEEGPEPRGIKKSLCFRQRAPLSCQPLAQRPLTVSVEGCPPPPRLPWPLGPWRQGVTLVGLGQMVYGS